MKITVAICTWNRAALLDRTLSALRNLRIPPDVQWEVLVVNNRCTDTTDDVIARHEGSLPIRRLFETRQGHSYARNRAVAAATGDLIIWTDDDVVVDEAWLSEYAREASGCTDAAFFGGTVEPLYAVEPPHWIRRHILRLNPYVITQHGPGTRPLQRDEPIAGANMAFRTDVLRRYPFNVALGRVADSLVGADDTELVGRLKADGLKGVWIGGAKVQHCIEEDRLTLDYVRRWYVGAGRTHYRLHGLPPGRRLYGVPIWVLRQYAVDTVRSWCGFPFKGAKWVEAFRSAAILWGMILEARTDYRAERFQGRTVAEPPSPTSRPK